MEIRVIVEDGFISVNGEALMGFDLSAYCEIKAIQSIDGKTHVLKQNGDGDFDDAFDLQPFVDLFNDRKELESVARQAWENSPERLKQERIAELRTLLKDSDFKVLPDYDGDITQIKIDRHAWRVELRGLLDD